MSTCVSRNIYDKHIFIIKRKIIVSNENIVSTCKSVKLKLASLWVIAFYLVEYTTCDWKVQCVLIKIKSSSLLDDEILHKILSKIFKSLTSIGVEAVVDDVVIDGTTAWPMDGFLTNNSAPLYLALNLGGEPLGVTLGAEFYSKKKIIYFNTFFES